MNSANQTAKRNRKIFICCIFLLASVILLALDFAQVSNLTDININITKYQSGQFQQYLFLSACRSPIKIIISNYQYRFQNFGECCYFLDYTYCKSKSSCIDDLLIALYADRDNSKSSIWIYSLLSAASFFVFLLLLSKVCKGLRPNHNPPNRSINDLNVNLSSISSEKQKRIDVRYDSFAYYDQQNNCCICLEEFKDEKAILLKCGHIFHSCCIRDWSAKQQNCPICRSSQ